MRLLPSDLLKLLRFGYFRKLGLTITLLRLLGERLGHVVTSPIPKTISSIKAGLLFWSERISPKGLDIGSISGALGVCSFGSVDFSLVPFILPFIATCIGFMESLVLPKLIPPKTG